MAACTVTIPGPPVPKGRPRFSVLGKRVLTHTPDKTRRGEAAVAACVAALGLEAPMAGPVRVEAVFVCKRPQRLMRRKDPAGWLPAEVRPDLDNYVKLLLDGLAAVWGDDGQVVEVQAVKVFAEKDGEPRTVVRVTQVEAPAPAWAVGLDYTAARTAEGSS